MGHRLFPALCALMILLLGSCVSTRAAGGLYVTDTVQVELLPTSCMEDSYDALCQFSGSYGERTFSMLTYSYANQDQIALTIMTPMGNTIANLTYEGNAITQASSTLTGVPFPAEYLFFDFQLCFYRAESLEEMLKRKGLSFEEEKGEGGVVRTLRQGEKVITRIEKGEGFVRLVNLLRGYSYQIEDGGDA